MNKYVAPISTHRDQSLNTLSSGPLRIGQGHGNQSLFFWVCEQRSLWTRQCRNSRKRTHNFSRPRTYDHAPYATRFLLCHAPSRTFLLDRHWSSAAGLRRVYRLWESASRAWSNSPDGDEDCFKEVRTKHLWWLPHFANPSYLGAFVTTSGLIVTSWYDQRSINEDSHSDKENFREYGNWILFNALNFQQGNRSNDFCFTVQPRQFISTA